MSDRLTPKERHALNLMFEAHRRYPDERYEAATCMDATYLDSTWPVFLHWRTAKSLVNKDMAVVIEKDLDGWSIALTDEVLGSRGMSRAVPADHDANVRWLR